MNVKYRTPGFAVAALLGSALFLAVDGVTSVAWADRCGRSDRVPLPSCVSSWYDGPRYSVTNNCDFSVTLTVNVRSAPDLRFKVGPGRSRDGTVYYVWGSIRNIKCCPRYGRCTQENPS